MTKTICFIAIFLVCASPLSAGNGPLAIPAKESDFIGVWRLILKDNKGAKQILKEDPWPANCQYFGHYKNGIWLHQQVHLGECKLAMPELAPNYPENVTWKMDRDGTFIITRPDVKIKEPWKVDVVTRDAHLGKVNLNKGDLIMQLYLPDRKGFMYSRIMRKVR
ncbi:MAG: hypothetical protein AB7D06_10285 [Pedobacter sp.]